MKDETNFESKIHPALSRLQSVELEPSPFLSARVQANLRAMASSEAAPGAAALTFKGRFLEFLRPWKVSVVFAMALVLLVLALPFKGFLPSPMASYAIGKPYLIRVDVRALEPEEVAYAEIEIKGDSAQFKSKAFEKVAENRKITVDAEIFKNKQYLPIIVEGIKKGQSQVLVSFFDKNNKLINSRVVDLSFEVGS
jgi:hypothetical protein